MKILEQGKIKQILKIKKCKICKSVFTYSEEDAMVIFNTRKEKISVGVVCPVCEELIKISAFDRKAK